MTADVTLCPVTPVLLPQIVLLEARCFSDSWSEKAFLPCLDNPCMVFTAAVDPAGQVLGYLLLMTAADEAEILNLAAAPEARRRGIGRGLLRQALETARQRGAANCYLEVRASNEPALALYTAEGFCPAGRRKNYYTNPKEDAILMRRSLETEDPLC